MTCPFFTLLEWARRIFPRLHAAALSERLAPLRLLPFNLGTTQFVKACVAATASALTPAAWKPWTTRT